MLHVARQYVDVTGLQDKLKRHELNILFELHVNLEQLKYYILHPRQPIAKIRVQLIVIMQSKLARSDKCLHQIVRKNYKKGRWNKKNDVLEYTISISLNECRQVCDVQVISPGSCACICVVHVHSHNFCSHSDFL